MVRVRPRRVRPPPRDVRECGATFAVGGERREDVGPYFYAPTVLTGLPGDARAAREETFGPVVALQSVESDAAAIERADDSTYGLHGVVLSGDVDGGRAVAREIEAGSVAVNDAYVTMWAAHDAPMGGVGDYRHRSTAWPRGDREVHGI